MHRIDTKTAQKDKFGAGKNGFTRGNPQTGTPATDLDDDYFDMLQEELCGVVEASGASLEKGRHDQLLTALRALLLSRKNPFGDIKSDGATDVARKNLDLGTAALKSAQTSVSDRTNGALMLVGAFGFGGEGGDSVIRDITNVFTLPIGNEGNPEPYQNYVHLNLAGNYFYSARLAISLNDTDNPRFFLNNRAGDAESDWMEIYTARNPQRTVAQLTTARKISLSGDASGYAMFNGGADANIAVTVADSAKGVIKLREGAVSTLYASNNFISIDTGLMVRGITFSANAQSVNVRPLQMLIGTQWVTVGLS